MKVLEWKKINLLNFNVVEKLQNIRADITAACYNNTKTIFTDILGNVHVFSSKWELISFKAHNNEIKFCAITNGNGYNGTKHGVNSSVGSNLLVTLEQEAAAGNQAFLQVFNLNEMTKRSGAVCVGNAKLNANSAVKTLRIQQMENQNQLCIVVGCDNGNLLVHRAPISRDMSSNFRPLSITTRPITGIELRQNDLTVWSMFVCSNGGVFCYTLTENNVIADSKNVLDRINMPTTCCALTTRDAESYFTIGRDDAVYCFTSDGRGPCYAIEGRKQFLTWFGNHLVIILRLQYGTLSTHAAAPSILVVIDVHNKIVVLNKQVEPIVGIVIDEHTQTCYLTAASKKVYALSERDMHSKVRLLTKKNLYDVALHLLQGTENDEFMAQVNMQYGNYLLEKGDAQAAVDRYKKTLGSVEPYRVIRQLLDSRFNEYLTQYLRELVRHDCASPDHVKLLRSCEEREDLPLKIKDIFVGSDDVEGSVPAFYDINNFESKHNTGEPTHANIGNFLGIVRDRAQWPDARIYDYLAENWDMFMSSQPEEFLALLKALCSDERRPGEFAVRLVPLLMPHTKHCLDFVEHVISTRRENEMSSTLRNTLLDLYLREWRAHNKSVDDVLGVLAASREHLSAEHMMFLCRHYNFWDGLMALDDNGSMRRSCMLHCSKKFDANAWNADMLYNEQGIANCSPKVVGVILNSLLQENQHSLLQVLDSIADNEKLTVSQIRDIFANGQRHTTIGAEKQQQIVQRLQDELHTLKTLLANFSTKPIEFRSSICDLCKRPMKPPGLYYMCQHTFHKDCAFMYTENNSSCGICNDIVAPKHNLPIVMDLQNKMSEYNNDIMEVVATFFANGEYRHFEEVNSSANKPPSPQDGQPNREQSFAQRLPARPELHSSPKVWPGRLQHDAMQRQQIPKTSTNPFDVDGDEDPPQTQKEYDANLNPFAN